MTSRDALRFPSLDGLRAFEAAARLGSYEQAADELAVGASAVGKRIAALESLIGAELLQRGGKALTLTAAGRDYLAQVRPALTLLAAVPQHRRPDARGPRLRVSAPPTFARQLLVPELGAYAALQPAVQLELVLSIPFLDVRPGDADVEILHGDVARLGLRELMHERVWPLAAPALRARLPALPCPADLAALPLLRTPIEPWTPWFAAAGLPWPEPTEGPMLVDLGLTLEAAVAGQGVALARPSLAHSWLAAGSLVPVLPLGAEPAHQYGVRHSADAAARQFAQWLGECCTRRAATAAAQLAAQLSGTA
ncbi:MAG: LysR substrate-binding domain-containing protein [Rubrivivax sp.]|nr:LysR substrate-binding domain-containing protein [Rubrivivax sp.]MDH5339027.1 LysR substrate-binding domain-containing protein [Rubrivivax sp.]